MSLVKFLSKLSNWETFKSWWLPSICVLCSALAKRHLDLCVHCEAELPWLTSACQICAVPLVATENKSARICGKCIQYPPAFSAVKTLFHYQPPIDNFIMALKFHQQLLYARLFGELLSLQLQKIYEESELPELIIPVPLHSTRLRERGFNQAVEIARPIAKQLRLPLDIHSCERVRMTTAQSLLPANERHNNIKNAFAVKIPIATKYVAIVDDVITTGQTVNELSKVLHQVGVERIDIWSVARTDTNGM